MNKFHREVFHRGQALSLYTCSLDYVLPFTPFISSSLKIIACKRLSHNASHSLSLSLWSSRVAFCLSLFVRRMFLLLFSSILPLCMPSLRRVRTSRSLSDMVNDREDRVKRRGVPRWGFRIFSQVQVISNRSGRKCEVRSDGFESRRNWRISRFIDPSASNLLIEK